MDWATILRPAWTWEIIHESIAALDINEDAEKAIQGGLAPSVGGAHPKTTRTGGSPSATTPERVMPETIIKKD